jgi:hypothetical protein
MTTLDRLMDATETVAALVSVDPVYRPILDRLDEETEAHSRAARLAASRRVVMGRRLKAQAA